MERRFFPGDAPYAPSTAVTAVLALDQGRLIGFAAGHISTIGGHSYGLLQRTAVAPRYRGAGLNSRMVGRLFEEFLKQGIKEVRTYVVPWNAPSINSLYKAGFRVYAPRKKWGRDDAVYMRCLTC
jgi:RimJ/RimL family protein N-acetyltransferase